MFKTITMVCFWLAFGAFLAVSIPHVAYVFRVYEPQGDGYDGLWWLVSYGAAIGIDVLICWLSYSRASEEKQWIVWSFIGSLALLSWYCNWIFALDHTHTVHVDVWNMYLGNWTVGQITPLLVSAIPLYIIAYAYMSNIIVRSGAQKTADQLQQEADELEVQLLQKQRIASLKNASQSSWFSGKIGLLREVQSALITEKKSPTSPSFQEQNLPEEKQTFVENVMEQDIEIVPENDNENQKEHPEIVRAHTASQASPRTKYTMTYEEASLYTGYSIAYLKSQVSQGKMKVSLSGKLLVSTLRVRSGHAREIPAVQLVERVS